MITDCNPSVLFLSYGKPEATKLVLEAIKHQGCAIREIRLFDIEIPMDRYKKTMDFFHQHIMFDYWQDRQLKVMDNMFVSMAIKKLGYNPIKLKSAWQHDPKSPYLFSLLCPIAYQDTSDNAETTDEKANFEKLKEFKA